MADKPDDNDVTAFLHETRRFGLKWQPEDPQRAGEFYAEWLDICHRMHVKAMIGVARVLGRITEVTAPAMIGAQMMGAVERERLDDALRILALVHTDRDALTGIQVAVGATPTHSNCPVEKYVDAWRVVREHLELPVDPDPETIVHGKPAGSSGSVG